jgi:hypothetical protein
MIDLHAMRERLEAMEKMLGRNVDKIGEPIPATYINVCLALLAVDKRIEEVEGREGAGDEIIGQMKAANASLEQFVEEETAAQIREGIRPVPSASEPEKAKKKVSDG